MHNYYYYYRYYYNYTTTTVLQPFVRDYQGEPIPKR